MMLYLVLACLVRHFVFCATRLVYFFARSVTETSLRRWETVPGFVAEAYVFWLELAISFAFLARESARAGRLTRWLPLLALLLTAATVALEAGGCWKFGSLAGPRLVAGLCACVTCGASALSLLVVCVRSRLRGTCVENRNAARALLFACHALVTELPYAAAAVVVLFDPGSAERISEVLYPWVFVVTALSGVGIAVTFFWQSRYANPAIVDVAKLTTTRSFSVRFAEEVAIV